MTKFLFFIFLLISFFSLATEEERKALLKKVKSAVTEQQKIITSIELTEFYESYDYQKWQEEIRQLKDKFRNVKNKKVKNKIALSLAKNALSTGNQDEFIKYFKSLDFENLAFDRGTLTDFNFLKIKSRIAS
jgi:hypothetical protein